MYPYCTDLCTVIDLSEQKLGPDTINDNINPLNSWPQESPTAMNGREWCLDLVPSQMAPMLGGALDPWLVLVVIEV
ncbi:hypothetical protein PENANT_c009G09999 [Penicillium antarcticum]|uniref:Uncharacterized protein n=1 Tax=Penicillium antarcticum TaxID=416450 RepID=A0A1V6Q8U1_9EURO|nr:hypothetical protein PENANT_c009G09999 [Penicillium antarcticum]